MQKTLSRSFRLRLMALVMLGILPPLLSVLWYASYRAARVFRAEAQQTMTLKANALGEQVSQWYEQNSRLLDDLRARQDFASMDPGAQLPTMVSALQAMQAEVEAVVTVDLEGEVVAEASSKPRQHRNYRNQAWFTSAVAHRDNQVQTSLVSESGKRTVIFSKPILTQPTLRVGDRNAAVSQLQGRLKNLGYYAGPIDGIYEGQTVAAIATFKQIFHREEAPGDQVDPPTWQAIALAEQAKHPMRGKKAPADLHSADAQIEGVIMMEAELDVVQQAVRSVQIGSSGHVLVLNEQGQILAQSLGDASPLDSRPPQPRKPAAAIARGRKLPAHWSNAALRQLPQPSRESARQPTPTDDLLSVPTSEPGSSGLWASITSLGPFLQWVSGELLEFPPLPSAAASETAGSSLMSSPAALQDNLEMAAMAQLPNREGSLRLRWQGHPWIAHRKTLDNGWRVVLLQPGSEFSREARLFHHLSLVSAVIALGAVFTAIAVLSARLSRPILRLSTAATALSQGQLNQKVEVESADEIGTLATAFNTVADQLQLSFAQLASQNEALKRLDQLKDQFLANTSHELKTPLNGMIGIAESLLEGAAGTLTEAQRHNVAMIAASSHRLTRLVNDILDFSKLKNQQLTLHCKPVGIRASVEVVLVLSRSLMGAKPVEILHDIPADLPLVYADENRLQQILLNLVSNAIKFTHSGRVRVSAQPYPGTGDTAFLAISIQDTGIGIAADRLEHIFHPFQQFADSALEEGSFTYGGTGLGLSITRNLVSLHGGEIWVESRLNEGSIFTFTLPLAPLPAALEPFQTSLSKEAAGKPRGELNQLLSLRQKAKLTASWAKAFVQGKSNLDAQSPIDPSKFNLLVVDDEPINVQVLNNQLSLANYTVTHALSGTKALALIEEAHKAGRSFDLVVLDVMMPRMSGYEVCARLREMYPAHELPVIMLTAKNQVSDLMAGFQFGASDYMTKPFSKDELLTRIKAHLRLSKTNHAYGRFVPGEYLEFLNKDSIVEVQLGDHVSKEMAVMFSDIRAFTTLSERMTPQENFDFVNSYLRQVSPVIRSYSGFIVKYLGDGMMAVFPEGVDDAIAAGVAKLRSVAEFNRARANQGMEPIAVGIGLHFGHMMVGMVGESARMQGDAFSDNVNLTARLESLTKHYGVSMVISGQAYDLMAQPQQYRLRFLDRVIVKGRSEPIDLYQVLDGESEATVERLEQSRDDFEAGVSYYQSGSFQQAKFCFEQVLLQAPDDKAAQVYCDRLSQLLHTPPKQWQGIWSLAQK